MRALWLVVGLVAQVCVGQNATDSPSLPTPFPTLNPTSLSPTLQPTAAVSLCNNMSDTLIYEDDKFSFDDDLAKCGVSCSINVVTDTQTLVECMRDCYFTKTDRIDIQIKPLSRMCSLCWGYYAECMVDECECPGARFQSENCVECSAKSCEPSFTRCTGGFVIPEFVPEEKVDTGLIGVIAGTTAGGLLCIGMTLSVCWVLRVNRHGRRGHKADVNLDPVAVKIDSFSSLSPQFSNRGVPAVPAPAPKPVRQNPVTATGEATFKVAFTFSGENEDELTALAGTILKGIERAGDEWYYCKNESTGKKGYIPIVNLSQL